MSESEDEFGSLAPTTPLVPIKKLSRTAESRAIAGPSKPASKTGRGKGKYRVPKKTPQQSEIDDGTDRHDISSEHEEVDDVAPTAPLGKTKRSNASMRAESVMKNGNTAAKGKERAKADPKASRTVAQTIEPMDVDIELIEDTEPVKHGAQSMNTTGRSRKATGSSTGPSKADISTKELERLHQKLQDVEAQRNTLSQQLEELHRVRVTEAEQLLEQQTLQYEARLQTQEALIKELTSQAARAEPLTRSGNGSILHLLTRETADEEKRAVERELAQWKDIARTKDDTIAANERKIAELQQSAGDLRVELQAEIERNKILTNASRRPMPSQGHAHSTVLGIDNPKHTEVIKLYEDLTNLLVPSLKFTPGKYLSLDDAMCTCIYTAGVEGDGEEKGKSLSFVLRFYYDVADPEDTEPVTTKGQLLEMVQYTPLELDKESSDFIDRLDFLGDSFTFGRNQLPIFLNTLQKNMSSAPGDVENGDREGSEPGEIMEVEDD